MSYSPQLWIELAIESALGSVFLAGDFLQTIRTFKWHYSGPVRSASAPTDLGYTFCLLWWEGSDILTAKDQCGLDSSHSRLLVSWAWEIYKCTGAIWLSLSENFKIQGWKGSDAYPLWHLYHSGLSLLSLIFFLLKYVSNLPGLSNALVFPASVVPVESLILYLMYSTLLMGLLITPSSLWIY